MVYSQSITRPVSYAPSAFKTIYVKMYKMLVVVVAIILPKVCLIRVITGIKHTFGKIWQSKNAAGFLFLFISGTVKVKVLNFFPDQ